MFEDRWWDDGGPDPVEDSAPWECDEQIPLEELIAGDPEPDRSLSEFLLVAEHAPVTSELAALDLSRLSDSEKIAVIAAAQRQLNHFEGLKLAAIASFAGPEPRDDVEAATSAAAFAWSEIAAALKIGEGTGRAVTHDGQRLASHLPATLALMLDGDLSWPKARTLLDATAGLTREQCREVEDLVLGKAAGRTSAQHTQAVGRAVRKIDPDGWARRREQKLADVALIRFQRGDGVADLLLKSLDSYESELLWTAADTWARSRKAAGDPRTLDALRVAAIVDWAATYLTGTPVAPADPDVSAPTPPTRNGQPATVNIIIGLPDLADPTRGGAATITGTSEPLPADAVAELLRTGARIRFALVDTHGRLVGISTRLHDPTALQRVFVALRDLSLRVPGGSTAPVAGQDLDHINPHGPTEPDNLHPPSRGWHRAKTFGHWTVTANKDGTITWTSRRTGRTYTTHPYDYRAGP
jgi:hypothetical protein